VLLLFGLALILNVGTSAAATPTTVNPTIKVTSVDPVNNSVIPKSQTVKVTFNNSIEAGTQSITLKNGKNIISTTKSFSGNTLSIIPTKKLSIGKYVLTLNANSVTDLTGNGNSLYTSSFTVSPITLAQMTDGQKRAQTFFNNNQRLPNYVSYGSTHILIAQFQTIIATQGLKINTKITNPNASLASIMKAASKFRYSGAASTGAAMERIGSGDCWAMSDYLYTKMTAAHMHARIIQYPTSYVNNHRSVQYLSNGAWVNAPYRTYFSTNMFNNTQSTGIVIRRS
jgi:methionine-rich copper-binding protein CopC